MSLEDQIAVLKKAMQKCVEGQPLLIASAWEPIETAPRDGTDILVTGAHNLYLPYAQLPENRHYVEITHWGKDNGVEQFLLWCGNYSQPTHWMPLPTPPKTDSDNV